MSLNEALTRKGVAETLWTVILSRQKGSLEQKTHRSDAVHFAGIQERARQRKRHVQTPWRGVQSKNNKEARTREGQEPQRSPAEPLGCLGARQRLLGVGAEALRRPWECSDTCYAACGGLPEEECRRKSAEQGAGVCRCPSL